MFKSSHQSSHYPKVVVAIPTFNGANWLGETLRSLLIQDYPYPLEILVSDDASTDHTISVVQKTFKTCNHSQLIKLSLITNTTNKGYPVNLQRIKKYCDRQKVDILYLLGQDDLLLPGALAKTIQAFSNPKIGAVTRPYYWFWDTPDRPVRAVLPFNRLKNSTIYLSHGSKGVKKIFESVGQFSGLAYRMRYFSGQFHSSIFPSHIYPFARIVKKHPVVFLKDYTVAVRIRSSQTRLFKSTYFVSPTASWVEMFRTVFAGPTYSAIRFACIGQICTHHVGLIQLKNYGRYRDLLKELVILIWYFPLNLVIPSFYLFAFVALVIPSSLLKKLTDWYKQIILAGYLSTKHIT